MRLTRHRVKETFVSADLHHILAQLPLFNTLDENELAELIKLMAMQSFTANQAIIVEGHPPPGLYVILSGKVAVMKNRGDKADLICDLDGGECVGEVEIIDNAPCTANVVCYGDVETAVIVKDSLEGYFTAQPAAANKILRQMVHILSARLRQTNVSYTSLMHIAESIGDEE